jgi:hypothetical protein
MRVGQFPPNSIRARELVARLRELDIVARCVPLFGDGLHGLDEVWLADPGDAEIALAVLEELEAEASEHHCPNCRYDLNGHDGARPCPECGHPVRGPGPDRICPECGQAGPATFTVCWSCGGDVCEDDAGAE